MLDLDLTGHFVTFTAMRRVSDSFQSWVQVYFRLGFQIQQITQDACMNFKTDRHFSNGLPKCGDW